MTLTPSSVDIFLTRHCNLRCGYCFMPKTVTRLSQEMGQVAIDWLLSVTPLDTATVSFYGGEPLMEWELMKALTAYGQARAKSARKRFKIQTTTNGTLMTDEIQGWIIANQCHLTYSMDGMPETQNANRPGINGEGSYNAAARRLQSLWRAGYFHTDRLTYTAENVHRLADNVRHLWGLGSRGVMIGADVLSAWTDQRLCVLTNQLRMLSNDILASGPRNYRKLVQIEQLVHKFHERRGSRSRSRRQRQCGAGNNYMAISTNGDIYPCHRLLGAEAYRLGNIDGEICEDAAAVLQGLDCNSDHPGCFGCQARKECSGGCIAVNLAANGSPTIPSQVQCAIARIERDITAEFVRKCSGELMLAILANHDHCGGRKCR